MLNCVLSFFYKKTNPWLIGLFFISIILMFLILPAFENILHLSEDMVSLDKPFLYSNVKIFDILTDWGEEGRFQQILFHLTWDLVLPVIYFFFLGFLLSWFAKRGFKSGSRVQKITLLSLVAVADILENIFLLVLILIYPENVPVIGWIKTGLTFMKYYLFGPLIPAVLLIAVIFALKNRMEVQE
jgi:hypothetical protein